MKIHSLQPSKKRSHREKRNSLLIIAFFLVVLIFRILFPVFFATVAYYVAWPVWKIRDSIIEKNSTVPFFETKAGLKAENNALKIEIAQTKVKLLKFSNLEIENREFRAREGRATTSPKTLLATVISKPPFSPYDTLLIDIGSFEGVRMGSTVTVFDNVLLGKIVEVNKHFSKVRLYSSPGEEIPVEIGSEHLETLAYGKGGGNFESRLPRDFKVAQGDTIVIPALGGKIYAVVEKIYADEAESFQIILFKVPVNIYTLHFVEVEI